MSAKEANKSGGAKPITAKPKTDESTGEKKPKGKRASGRVSSLKKQLKVAQKEHERWSRKTAKHEEAVRAIEEQADFGKKMLAASLEAVTKLTEQLTAAEKNAL